MVTCYYTILPGTTHALDYGIRFNLLLVRTLWFPSLTTSWIHNFIYFNRHVLFNLICS